MLNEEMLNEEEISLHKERAIRIKKKIAKVVLNEIKGLPAHEAGNLIGEIAFSFVDWAIKNITDKKYLNDYTAGLKGFVQKCTEEALLNLSKKKEESHVDV